MILSKREIIKHKLISYLLDINEQICSHGVFVTVGQVFEYKDMATLGFDSSFENLPSLRELSFDSKFCIDLKQGAYFIVFNEKIKLNNKITAHLHSSENLIKSGSFIESRVFLPNFSGKLYCILNIPNSFGLRLIKHARLATCVFEESREQNISSNQAIFEGIKKKLEDNQNLLPKNE